MDTPRASGPRSRVKFFEKFKKFHKSVELEVELRRATVLLLSRDLFLRSRARSKMDTPTKTNIMRGASMLRKYRMSRSRSVSQRSRRNIDAAPTGGEPKVPYPIREALRGVDAAANVSEARKRATQKAKARRVREQEDESSNSPPAAAVDDVGSSSRKKKAAVHSATTSSGSDADPFARRSKTRRSPTSAPESPTDVISATPASPPVASVAPDNSQAAMLQRAQMLLRKRMTMIISPDGVDVDTPPRREWMQRHLQQPQNVARGHIRSTQGASSGSSEVDCGGAPSVGAKRKVALVRRYESHLSPVVESKAAAVERFSSSTATRGSTASSNSSSSSSNSSSSSRNSSRSNTTTQTAAAIVSHEYVAMPPARVEHVENMTTTATAASTPPTPQRRPPTPPLSPRLRAATPPLDPSSPIADSGSRSVKDGYHRPVTPPTVTPPVVSPSIAIDSVATSLVQETHASAAASALDTRIEKGEDSRGKDVLKVDPQFQVQILKAEMEVWKRNHAAINARFADHAIELARAKDDARRAHQIAEFERVAMEKARTTMREELAMMERKCASRVESEGGQIEVLARAHAIAARAQQETFDATVADVKARAERAALVLRKTLGEEHQAKLVCVEKEVASMRDANQALREHQSLSLDKEEKKSNAMHDHLLAQLESADQKLAAQKRNFTAFERTARRSEAVRL